MALDWKALLDAVRVIASARTEEDSVIRVAGQAERLFGVYRPHVIVDVREQHVGRSFALEARGERIGEIVFSDDVTIAAEDVQVVAAFAEHAALALHNARLLDEHEHQSRRDGLTGLRNYRAFRETLSALLPGAAETESRPLSLVVIDLDRFKAVNDRHGHAAGDRLLRSAAAALSSVCRVADCACRIGGDEFALILPGADGGQARRVAERAQRAIARLAGSVGASWGVAAAPVDGSTLDELMAAADTAMYKRKRPEATAALASGHTRRRLAMVARLTTRLTEHDTPVQIALSAVEELHGTFGYYLAVVQRLDPDQVLRVVAGAGPLADTKSQFLAWEQPITSGINGRVARSNQTAVIPDTRLDPDYLAYDSREDPGSEVSVPISVNGRVWGILNLEQIATYGFDESDVHLAEAVAAVTAAAIHRCLTIDQVRNASPSAIAFDTI
jgi:diguanylate cyclase (GGDEF)-like protein